MLKEREAFIRRVLILVDALVVMVVFFLTIEMRRHFHQIYRFDFFPDAKVVAEFAPTMSDYLVVLFLSVPLWCVMLYLNGMYRSMRVRTILETAWIVLKSAFLVAIVFGSFVFLFKLKFVSRAFFFLFLGMCAVAITIEKAVIFSAMHRARKRGHNFRRVLIAGTGRRAHQMAEKIHAHPEWGLKIVGAIDFEEEKPGQTIDGLEVIGAFGDLARILHTRAIDEVIFVVNRNKLGDIENYLYVCQIEGVKATVAVDFFELKISHLRQGELDGIPVISFETTFAKEWQLFIKRTIDLVVSGLGIILLSPLLLMVTVLIKASSPGPVFFMQKRVGLNGRKFILYKFRSMYKGAHKGLLKLSRENEAAGPVFKIKDDPRITPVGRFLRKFSIDELPQLFNVFMGHMSLVGPRPPVLREVRKYEPWQRRRLSMRPGITCLWQISGRSNIDFDQWMKLDLDYLDNWSLWLDFKILTKTIPAVLFGRGAY